MPSNDPTGDEDNTCQRPLGLENPDRLADDDGREFGPLVEKLHHGDLTREEQLRLGNLLLAASEPGSPTVSVATRQVSYQGPLPPPAQLNEYDDDTRRTIVNMALNEQQHAHTLREKSLHGAISKDKRGQRYGLTVAVVGLVVAGFIAPFSSTAAAIIGTLDLLGMVTVFVAPRLLENSQRDAASSINDENSS